MVGWVSDNMRSRNSHRSDSDDNGIQSSEYVQFCKAHDHVVTYLARILEDCFNMNPQYSRADFRLDLNTLVRRFSHEGLSFATKTLPTIFDSLLEYLETGNSDYPSFKLKPGKPYPVFLQRLIAPIYEDCTSEQTVICMKCLYQLCVAFKKLKGPYKPGTLVKQLNEFCDTDRDLPRSLPDGEVEVKILSIARNIVRQVCQGINPIDINQSEDFIPRPGPGATNHPTKKHERYRPHVCYAQLEALFKMEEWYSSQPVHYRGHRATILPNCATSGEHIGHPPLKGRGLLTSRFAFVHKTFGKARGICIEELEMQWLQQAVRRGLYDAIENHPLTKGHVSFSDQTINGLIALLGSYLSTKVRFQGLPLDIATIDMKEASDRIARILVEFLYQDNVELLNVLLTLSTRVIELPKDLSPDRRFIFAQKFAPMGSALCFPVMGLVHYALVKAIIAVHSPQHVNDIPVWVYGDDIIVEAAHAQNVFDWLPKFGMKLNVRKSFVKSLFRESCGVHAYNGVVITPVRFSSVLRRPLTVKNIVSALENESALYKRGFHRTAEFIRSELYSFKEVRAKAFPFVGRKSPVLGFIRDDEEVARIEDYFKPFKSRGMVGLQRMHYKTRVIVDKLDDCPPISDDEYYMRKLVDKTQPFEARTLKESSNGLTVHWAWLPDSSFFQA